MLKKTTFLNTRLTLSISMDSLSPQVVSAAKLPILNPNEFDLWKIRIEQYFFMTDYSLWEVILNGDSLVPTRLVAGIVQPVAPTSAEQKLARKNELKARGTTTQNLAFVSSSNTDSTTDSISAAASVSTVCAKLLVLQPSGGYHAVPPPITRTFMPPKPDLVFHTAPIAVRTNHSAFTVQLSPSKPAQDLHSVQPVETSILAATPKPTSLKSNSSGKRRNIKTCFGYKSVNHLIKDCDYHAKKMAQPTPRNYAHRGNNKQNASLTHKNPPKHMVPAAVLTQSKPVSFTAVRPVSAAVPKIMVTQPRLSHLIVTKSKSPIRRHITRSQSPKTSNSPLRVTAVQALVVCATQGMQGKWVWRPKCQILDHDSRTTSVSMTLKRFNYNDALGRSKSVMAWVPKRI
nr:hypothetical protein [Tanacetum cinerariifolium]GEX54663.1 hypothetical protein [Tanacetum cinerariifolium]